MSNDERPESLAAQAAAWVPPWERSPSEPDRAYQAAHRVDGGPDGGGPDGGRSDAGGPDGGGPDGGGPDGGGPDADGDPDGEDSDGADSDGADFAVSSFAGPGAAERVEAAAETEVRAEQLAELESADHDDWPDERRSDERRPAELRPDDDEDRSGAGLADDDDDFDEAFEGGNPPGYEVSSPGEAVVDQPHERSGEDEPEPTDVHPGGEVQVPSAVEQAVETGEDEGGAPVDAPLPPDGDDAGDVFDAAADDDVSDDGDVDLPFTEVVPETDDDEDAALAADGAGFRPGGDFGTFAEPHGDNDETGRRPGAFGELDGGGDEVGELGDEASAYAAGAADAAEALRGAAGQQAAVDDEPDPDQVTGQSSAESGGDVGRAEAGSAVPVQGRRRRISPDDPGAAASRTSATGEALSGGAAAAVSVAAPALAAVPDRAAVALPALEDDAELASALEAIMLVVDEPVGELQLAEILEQPAERIARMLDDLSARYTAAGHGFDLRRAAGGWRLYTRPEYAGYVERFVLDGQSVRLTQAALETVAVVAYKQPVTRSRISAIRGVNCDGVMRTLVTRGLIEECGTESETGAYLYRTTALFLEKLGLNSVDQLPPLAPFLPDDVEEVLDATG